MDVTSPRPHAIELLPGVFDTGSPDLRAGRRRKLRNGVISGAESRPTVTVSASALLMDGARLAVLSAI